MKKIFFFVLIAVVSCVQADDALTRSVAHNNNYLLFREVAFNGVRQTIPVKAMLYSQKTEFQKIDVYETASYGNMLVIDGIVMLTQFDNFAYHEMMVHVPMQAHPNPERVLVIGGGDGGTITEILKYDSVKEVVLCEIDAEVIRVCKKYFPEFAASFSDPRLTVVAADGAQYIKRKPGYFDIICVDSTDEFGPAEVLFQKPFYQALKNALTKDGIAVTQSESIYYDTELVAQLYKQNKKLFPYASYYYTLIPTYPSGTIGFSFCSKKYDPFQLLDTAKIASIPDLKYYNADMHKAAFRLPQFVKKAIDKK